MSKAEELMWNFILTIWLFLMILTFGVFYYIIWKDGFSKISKHFEWLLDRVNQTPKQ